MTDLPPLSAGETIAPGDQNDHVLALQQRLADYGYFTDTQDGVFGESTEAAVREFQRAHNLIDDGLVGQDTWDALGQQPEAPAGPEPGDLSEDGHWRWDGADWVQAQPTAELELGAVSDDGHWRWDGAQWQPNTPAEDELTPELFQQVIAQSIQVNTSGTA